MEKLHIRLENTQLQTQLDWIIDRASETNFDYPAVNFTNLPLIKYFNNYFSNATNRNFGHILKCYGKIKVFNSVLKDLTNIN